MILAGFIHPGFKAKSIQKRGDVMEFVSIFYIQCLDNRKNKNALNDSFF